MNKLHMNYRAEVGMWMYLQRSPTPDIYMAKHQYAHFCNNPRLVHERDVRRITKYLYSMSTYTDLSYGNIWLYTYG